MSRNIVETLLGAAVLLVAGFFLFWSYGQSNLSEGGGIEIVATFDQADGISPGSDVRISGITVGRVMAQSLDPQTYRADVRFTINDGIGVPADTSAAIVSSGLLGSKYVSLQPGAEDVMLKNGDEITFTQSSISLEELIGKYVFGGTDGGGGSAAGQSGGDPFGGG